MIIIFPRHSELFGAKNPLDGEDPSVRIPQDDEIEICYDDSMSWLIFALLSAFFAALTAILAKIGVKDVDSNLATAIRTVVILVFAWGIVFTRGLHNKFFDISIGSFLFLILSGLATGLSWLFYFRALQLGNVSQVAPIDKLSLVLTILLGFLILHEKFSLPIIVGGVLMTVGALVIAFAK